MGILKAPSSTITWAFLAGIGAAIIWEVVGTFTEFSPSPGLIAGSTAFASGLVGKLVPEKRYKMVDRIA